MASDIEIDDELLEKAIRLGGHLTGRATVTEALQEYVARREHLEILQLIGKIDYYDDYNPKDFRNPNGNSFPHFR